MKAEKIVTKTEPINVEIGEATLLSIEEYKEAVKNIKYVDNDWWLRSPGKFDKFAPFVSSKHGNVVSGYNDHITSQFGVRPALRIDNLQSLNLKAGDKIILAGHNWTIISDRLALCDEIIGKSAFREDWKEDNANNYERSDIKKWLEHWAKENGLSEEQMSEVKDES